MGEGLALMRAAILKMLSETNSAVLKMGTSKTPYFLSHLHGLRKQTTGLLYRVPSPKPPPPPHFLTMGTVFN